MKGGGTVKLSEAIKIEIKRLVKEEMEKPREGEGEMMEEEVCVVCGRTFEPAEERGFTCSEACSQKHVDELARGLLEFAEKSDKRWSALRSSIQKEFGVTMRPFEPTASIIEKAMREYLKRTK